MKPRDLMATVNEQPAFNSDLFQQLLQPENLHRAWRQVKAGWYRWHDHRSLPALGAARRLATV